MISEQAFFFNGISVRTAKDPEKGYKAKTKEGEPPMSNIQICVHAVLLKKRYVRGERWQTEVFLK